MSKQIILEDSGERRFPRPGEPYVISHHVFTLDCKTNDDDWAAPPEDFTILREVQNDFKPKQREFVIHVETSHRVTAASRPDAIAQTFSHLASLGAEELSGYCNAEVAEEERVDPSPTLDTGKVMEEAVELLKNRGVVCTYEFPGYISIPFGEFQANFGTADGDYLANWDKAEDKDFVQAIDFKMPRTATAAELAESIYKWRIHAAPPHKAGTPVPFELPEAEIKAIEQAVGYFTRMPFPSSWAKQYPDMARDHVTTLRGLREVCRMLGNSGLAEDCDNLIDSLTDRDKEEAGRG